LSIIATKQGLDRSRGLMTGGNHLSVSGLGGCDPVNRIAQTRILRKVSTICLSMFRIGEAQHPAEV
jgi:hypothetical protein